MPTLVGNNIIRVKDGTVLPKRVANDFYPTPWPVIETAIDLLPEREMPYVADIGMGSGRWGQVAKDKLPASYLYGFEMNPQFVHHKYDIVKYGDVLDLLPRYEGGFDYIIGNPPFYLYGHNYVSRFFRTLNAALNDKGVMVLFARSAIMASLTRQRAIFSWWAPTRELKFVRRVSFYPEGHPRCGDSNATEHSLFVWEKGLNPVYVKTSWCNIMPNDDAYGGPHKGTNTWQHMQTALKGVTE